MSRPPAHLPLPHQANQLPQAPRRHHNSNLLLPAAAKAPAATRARAQILLRRQV